VTWLAVWLVGLGLADLVRAGSGGSLRWALPAGCAAVVALALLAGLTAPVDLVVLLASLLALGLWQRLSTQAVTTGTGHVGALASLAAGVAWLLALSGWASPASGPLVRWLGWADLPLLGPGSGTDPVRVLLVVGLVLVNLSTANVLVRLVLVSVGAMRPVIEDRLTDADQPSDRLRGGRLLGPMERVVILGLGLAGQLTAAGLVIAAKGLIRFPELQASRKDGTGGVDGVGIDQVTEYFLVGSFVSWLVALVSLALTR
jgi:hypothetical protein